MTKRNLTEVEAAEIYGPSVAWYRRARWQGDGPVYVKLSGKVLYPVDELERFFAGRLRKSTSDPGPAAKTAPADKQTAKVRQIGRRKETPSVGCSSSTSGQGGHGNE